MKTLDGKSFEGEVFLESGNSVSVTLHDSTRKSISLHDVQLATFTSSQPSMAHFGHLAEGWTNIDVGEVSIPGIAGQSNRLFGVRAGGGDIGGEIDSFHFIHFRASGDVDVVARVVSIDGADRLARAGLMLRDSLKPDAKFVFAAVNGAGESSVQQRTGSGRKAGPGSTELAPPVAQVSLPCWLKLSRSEKTFRAFRSGDGQNWQQIAAHSVELKDSCYGGLAVASHGALSVCTVLLDDVSRTVPGVRGQYFADANFSTLKTNRVDGNVSFQWFADPPVKLMAGNKFSVRWTGELQPKYSEPYTFYFESEDARLWVNGQELPHLRLRRQARDPAGPTPIPLLLKAENRYPFKFECSLTSGRGVAQLAWSSPSQGKEIISGKRLFCKLEAQAQPGVRSATTPAWVMGRGIMLRNGSFIAGYVRSVNDTGVKFTYRGDKEYMVPVHQVARTVFRVSPRNAILSDTALSPGALLGNGDFIEGEVRLGSGRSVKVSSVLLGLRNYNLDSSDLAALVFNDPSPAPVGYQVRLADNSVLMAKSLTVEQEEVSIVEPVVGVLRAPRDNVTEIRSGRFGSRPHSSARR